MTQMNKVGKVATKVINNNFYTRVIYHDTEVIKFNDETIVLDSGGWETFTTKVRMNQASNEYNLGFQVYQRKFQWFVDFKGQTIPFDDGMMLRRN